MAIQIVMDRTGDTRHGFDANDLRALAKAEKRFKELTKVDSLQPPAPQTATYLSFGRSIQRQRRPCSTRV